MKNLCWNLTDLCACVLRKEDGARLLRRCGRERACGRERDREGEFRGAGRKTFLFSQIFTSIPKALLRPFNVEPLLLKTIHAENTETRKQMLYSSPCYICEALYWWSCACFLKKRYHDKKHNLSSSFSACWKASNFIMWEISTSTQ